VGGGRGGNLDVEGGGGGYGGGVWWEGEGVGRRRVEGGRGSGEKDYGGEGTDKMRGGLNVEGGGKGDGVLNRKNFCLVNSLSHSLQRVLVLTSKIMAV